MLNLYLYHKDPQDLAHYDDRIRYIPQEALEDAFKKYKAGINIPKWQLEVIGDDSTCSYRYAAEVLNGPFKEGESSIAVHGQNSLRYSRNVLKGRFPLGEAAIKRDGFWVFYKNYLQSIGIDV